MTIREIDQIIEEGNSLKLIVQAYGEIAFLQIKKIRAEVERNRLFFNEIARVYKIVNLQAAVKKISVKKSKKVISIALTSNYRFYGNIDTQVLHLFIENTAKTPTDRIVIGKTGHEFLQSMRYTHKYAVIETKEDIPDASELNTLAQIIKDYQQVLVYYPQFITLLMQKPIMTDVAQSSLFGLPQGKAAPVSEYVIFEPELEKMIQFFHAQFSNLLLEQTFFEAELARTGSRLIAMDQAQVDANEFIKLQKQVRARLQRGIDNIKLLENLAALGAERRKIS